VFREVKRTLRDDGVFWLNLGDSYAGSWGNAGQRPELDDSTFGQRRKNSYYFPRGGWDGRRDRPASSYKLPNIKPKDLIGIPWKLAFALRDDGWWLRSDIIWAKGVSGQKELTSQIYNAGIEIGIEENKIEALIESLGLYVGNSMPESVVDRPSKSHEYLFMLTKSKKYFYDGEAVKEDSVTKDPRKPYTSKGAWDLDGRPKDMQHGGESRSTDSSKRNLRSVWTLVTKPFNSAHFATFPDELILNPIKSSTSEKGCCPACNAPYKRILLKKPMVIRKTDRMAQMGEFGRTQSSGTMLSPAESKTVGWQQTCSCVLDCAWGDPEPCLVLDPFMGSGTVGVVSKKLGRNFVGIDLNKDYVNMAEERIGKVSLQSA
jgi:DNA modification methylase